MASLPSLRAPAAKPANRERSTVVKVIASSVRKGNVLEVDGKLCVVMKAENIHPGKGTPVTHLDMRRISDGVKITERYRTTDQVERAYLEDKTYNYLYEDDTGYTFMDPDTYDQITVPKDLLGDQSAYLQESMPVTLSLHEGVPVAIELPPRVTLGNRRGRSRRQGPDGLVILQAGRALQWPARDGAAAYPGGHAGRRLDR